jgi:hypothetical protein
VKRLGMSKDEISNLMDCIWITKHIIKIKEHISEIKRKINEIKTNDFQDEEDVLDTLYEKLSEKFKVY